MRMKSQWCEDEVSRSDLGKRERNKRRMIIIIIPCGYSTATGIMMPCRDWRFFKALQARQGIWTHGAGGAFILVGHAVGWWCVDLLPTTGLNCFNLKVGLQVYISAWLDPILNPHHPIIPTPTSHTTNTTNNPTRISINTLPISHIQHLNGFSQLAFHSTTTGLQTSLKPSTLA